MISRKKLANFDYWLLAAVSALSIFGIICIGSATHINLGESKSQFYSQMVWFVIGLFLLCLTLKIDLASASRFHYILYGINLFLLIAVLFLGKNANGATRWIRFGPVGIQPSEFAKIIMLFCLSKLIDKKRKSINNISVLLFIFAYTLVPVLLIQMQPSLSASLVIIVILITLLFVAGLNYKYIIRTLAVLLPIGGFLIWDIQKETPFLADKIFTSYQMKRILSFINPSSDPDTYYQTLKSINAIGSGQLNGKGLFQGTLNQLSYLPEPHNDFIFSVIGEEFGYIGCILVLLLLLFIVFRCTMIALSSRDFFSQLIASGVAGMIAFQTFVNVGVTTGLLPNTGMSLPFVSYGGSSMWTNMIAIGLVLNIGLQRSKSLFEGA
ncbi:MAG: rod shape-determining protein RodA [Clostridiales bacterium]|nr:rod shape-determining protein RodA [Clostridiales bacterium]